MGPWLLAISNLTFTLFCVALVLSLNARIAASWKRRLLWLIPLGFLLFYTALAGWDVHVYLKTNASLGLRQHLIFGFLLIGYLVSVVVLWRRADRRAVHETSLDTEPAAQNWSPMKLGWMALLLFAVQFLVWWSLDSCAQQMLHELQLEAEIKALEITPVKLADKENAALVYKQAFALLPKDEEWDEPLNRWWQAIDEEPPNLQLQDPELIKFFAQQAPTLDLLYQAAELPACQFEQMSAVPDVDENFMDEVMHMREAARLLLLHAHLVHTKGDLQAAMHDVQTIHRLAAHEESGPMIVSLLVSYALDAMAQEALQELLSGRQPTTEELSPLKFEADYSRTLPLIKTFQMEEAFCLNGFSKLNSDSDYQLALARMMGFSDTSTEILNFPLLSFYRIFLLEEDIKAYYLAIDKYEEIAALPYSQADPQAEEIRLSMAKKHHGIMAQMLIPSLEATIHASANAAARHFTTQTAVAVHRFRATEGKLPQTLQELVPKYLPAVPLDPFDDQPLRWKITGEDWVVYSIGEDLKDDGGNPLDQSTYPPEGDICFFSRVPEPEPAEGDTDLD